MDTGVVAKALAGMQRSPVRNYVTPGLTSWLIGGEGKGLVRMFTSDRDTNEWITPHSHRFDFTCIVLAGEVENILFTRVYGSEGNSYCQGALIAIDGGLGGYEFIPGTGYSQWEKHSYTYTRGQTYSMTAKEIHSIRFSKGAKVLFLEGPEVEQRTIVLEPWSDGARVPTFETREWMFKREPQSPGEKQ